MGRAFSPSTSEGCLRSVTRSPSKPGQTDEDGVPAHIEVTLEVTRLDGRRADRIKLRRVSASATGDDYE